MNFNPAHNPVRATVKEAFSGLASTSKWGSVDQLGYLREVHRSKFVVSPPGTGEDCHRTWECVLLGAIPIVSNSTLWPLFSKAPTLVTDDWAKVADEAMLLNYRVPTKSRYTYFETISLVRLSIKPSLFLGP